MKIFKKILKEKKLRDDLRKKIKHLPSLKFNESEADNIWINYRNELRLNILHKNPRNFLRWKVIKGTMFVEDSPYAEKELRFLKSSPYWSTHYRKALGENFSGNLIHQLYHVSQFEAETGIMINKLTFVLEFGGGYGNMCMLFHNLGFKGKYIIFDSEEFGALQEYYLKSSGLEVVDLDKNSRFIKGVACISNLSKLKPLLSKRGKNLFLATWSISETSENFRNNFFRCLPNFENYLITYRDKFKEVDNVSYFSSFVKKRKDLYWKNWEIPHLKDNFYLIGSEKKM